MSEPFLKVVLQQHDFDCGVACLAMLLGVSYREALVAFGNLKPLVVGVTTKDVKQAAKRLSRSLRLKRHISLDEDTGILGVRSPQWLVEHLVVLKEGMIVDTDGTIWEAEVFMSVYDASPLSLLVAD